MPRTPSRPEGPLPPPLDLRATGAVSPRLDRQAAVDLRRTEAVSAALESPERPEPSSSDRIRRYDPETIDSARTVLVKLSEWIQENIPVADFLEERDIAKMFNEIKDALKRLPARDCPELGEEYDAVAIAIRNLRKAYVRHSIAAFSESVDDVRAIGDPKPRAVSAAAVGKLLSGRIDLLREIDTADEIGTEIAALDKLCITLRSIQ